MAAMTLVLIWPLKTLSRKRLAGNEDSSERRKSTSASDILLLLSSIVSLFSLPLSCVSAANPPNSVYSWLSLVLRAALVYSRLTPPPSRSSGPAPCQRLRQHLRRRTESLRAAPLGEGRKSPRSRPAPCLAAARTRFPRPASARPPVRRQPTLLQRIAPRRAASRPKPSSLRP